MLSDRFINSLPSGIKPEDVHIVSCTASVQQDELTDAEKLLVANVTDRASVPLINSEGKPTVMKVVAWMVHEGVNQNRQGFVKSELEALAPSLFHAPNFGVMDWNHSAVALFSDDPKVIGIWYNATFAFDQAAQKWGILATGMMFSWLFPEQANSLLADQERLGNMRFSMACIAPAQESAQDANGPYTILHNPVFFTVSALDVRPADPAALGEGSEDPAVSVDTIRQRLVAVAHSTPWQKLQAAQQKPASPKGERMDPEVLESLISAKVKAEADLAALVEKYNAEVASEVEEKTAGLTSDIAAAKAKIAELEAEVTASKELSVKFAELETVRDALVTEKDAAVAKVTELEAKVAELQAIADRVAAAEAEAAKAETLKARLELLPAAYRTAHEAREAEKKTAIEQRWSAMSDEEFAAVVEDIAGVVGMTDMRVSFLDRSNAEGVIPAAGSDKEHNISRFLRN